VPPVDSAYSIDKENPTDNDYKKRVYKCPEGHDNTVYWEKPPFYYGSTEYKTIGKQKDKPRELDDV